MFAILLLTSLVILYLIFDNHQRDWRSSILSSAVIWGTILAFLTEFLSLCKFITFNSVLGLWLLINIILSLIYYQLVKTGKRSLSFPKIPQINPVSLVLLSGVAFIVFTVTVIAIVAPPNNWDSLTYHMTRVVHWIQNQSLAHYATYYSAQLVHPPFAELAILNLQILSGGDRFANLVQTFSMMGSIIGVSLIAKQLGADQKGQILASVFCATLPMGILQSSSTQNDYVVCFWVVCLVHYILLTLDQKKPPVNLSLAIGASCGLAVFSKSSGYMYAFPFMLSFFFWYVIEIRWKIWKPLTIISVIFLSLNINHYLRNFSLYGNPLAVAEYAIDYRPGIYSIPTWISNIIRNLSLHADIVGHLGLQRIIEPTIGKMAKLITIIHGFLGVDINDPRITHPLNSYTGVPSLSFDENVAGNPLHLLLIFVAIGIFIVYKNLRNNQQLMIYLCCLISEFLLICLMLKLQPYNSRHHLTIFVLFSAFVGLVFGQICNRYVLTFMAVILLVTSMQFVVLNKIRPIATEKNIFNTTRNEIYFNQRLRLIQPYFDTAKFMQTTNCRDVGLSLGAEKVPDGHYWEYPFWVLLNDNKDKIYRFKHILNPENFYALKPEIYPDKDFQPCAIIAVRREQKNTVAKLIFQNKQYVAKWVSNPITILLPE